MDALWANEAKTYFGEMLYIRRNALQEHSVHLFR